MPRSYWRTILTVVGLVGLGLGLTVTYQLYDASQQRHSDYHYQPAGHPSRLVDVRGQPIAKSYQPNCENPQGNENSDLCAQWSAVDQVAESNRMASLNLRFAIASLWATAIATAALIWTLIETRETSRRELRAYLFVDASGILIGVKPHNLGKVIGVAEVKNSGATPAHRVRHWTAVTIAPVEDEHLMSAPAKLEWLHATTVPPSGGITGDRLTDKKPTAKQIADIRAAKQAVFLYGAIEYLDVFDREQRTNYRVLYAGIWPPPADVRMRFCNEGNDAT
jgi:hypothetical protein